MHRCLLGTLCIRRISHQIPFKKSKLFDNNMVDRNLFREIFRIYESINSKKKGKREKMVIIPIRSRKIYKKKQRI